MSDFSDFAAGWDWAPAPSAEQAVPVGIQWVEEPVPLDVFIRDPRYLKNPPLSDEQYRAVQHAERIFFPATYAELAQSSDPGTREYWQAPCGNVNFITLQWGKGGGKDHTCRVMSARVSYLLLCLPSALDYYGFASQDEIHLINVASSSQQANRAFFGPLRRAIMRKGCWLEQFADPLVGSIRFPFGEAISGHSDAETQEGLNILLGVADELDAFKRQEELEAHRPSASRESTKSAEAILKMMRSSMITRFPQVGKNVRISYPRYKGSMIQQLTQEARKEQQRRGDGSRHYVSGPLATWQVNPLRKRSDFDQEYEDDPVLSKSRYECDPAAAVNPYFSNEVAIESCVQEVEQDPLRVRYEPEMHRVIHPDGDQAAIRSWTTVYDFSAALTPKRGAIYAMHADLAVRKDRAGVCMAHVASMEEQEVVGKDPTGTDVHMSERRPVVQVDFLISYEANLSLSPPREIQVRWARELCLELRRRGFNVRWFSYDGYQCLSGDVKVPLLDGTTKTMRELEGSSPFWVYSLRDGRVVPGLCTKAWCTGQRDDMVEVELDNGEKVRTTADHLWMLRDGTYQRADELQPGDSLMPLYRRLKPLSQDTPEAMYEQVWHPEPDGSGKRWRFTHSMVSHYCYGPLSKGWVTHHKNVDRLDNRPDNLVQMTRQAHSALHRQMGEGKFARLWSDPEWSAQHRERLSRRRTAEQLGKTGSESKRYRHDITFQDVLRVPHSLVEAGQRLTWRVVAAELGCDQVPLYERLRAEGYASWKEFKWSVRPRSYGALATAKHEAKKRAVNHKVVAVRPSHPEKVYDLQVEEHHNFALGAGVFVHNSVDSMQILEANGIESKKVSTDLSTEPYRGLRDMFNEGRVRLPLCYPPDREPDVLRELYGLNKQPNGKLDHPVDGAKDLADSLACAVQGAVQRGGQEDGGIAYVGGQNFPVGPMSGLESMLPVGFVPPSGAFGGGFAPGEPLVPQVSLDAWEDQLFGGGDYDDRPPQQFSGPARPD